MMSKLNNWYVITGGPSSGKTTVIKELAKRGYKTLEETARKIIAGEMAKGKTLAEILAPIDTQHKIIARNIEREKGLDPNEVIFFDRAIPDTYAYYHLRGFEIDDTLMNAIKPVNYKGVFMLELLPKYSRDGVRSENKADAKIVENHLRKIYKDIGTPITEVPIMSVPQRVDFIIQKLYNT